MYNVTNKSTQHSQKTPFGYGTPHKLPTNIGDLEDLMSTVNQLYPTGRAWKNNENSVMNNLHKGLNISFLRFLKDAYSLIDGYFPDNLNFTENDCILAENKLGLNDGSNLSLEQRKQIILKKLTFPNGKKYRQSLSYIQKTLNDYGFNVGVYENAFFNSTTGEWEYKLPNEIQSVSLTSTQHSNSVLHGDSTHHGSGSYDVIANSMNDESYSFGGNENLWATFFIAAPNDISQRATIDSSRKMEFRQLVLKLKPAHLVAFTFINY